MSTEKNENIKSKYEDVKPSKKTCIRIGLSCFVLFLAITYWPFVAKFISRVIGAASPLLIGCIIAYPLNILMSFYEKHYFPNSCKKSVICTRRVISLIIAIITLIAIVSLVVGLILPQIIECVRLIIAEFPDAAKSFVNFLDEHSVITDKTIEYLESIDWKSKIGQAIEIVTSGITNVMGTVFSVMFSVFSSIFTGVMGVVFAMYILLSKEKIGNQFNRILKQYFNPKWHDRVKYTIHICNDSFHKYIVGQCIEALILGCLCTLGMFIIRLPYAAMIGALVALTALIPIAGAYIGAGVGAFLIFMESPIKSLIFLIFIIVLQQIEGNLIFPKVVGSSIGLPSIWVLAAVTVGGGIMGIGGMLLGVPIASSIYKIIKHDVKKRERIQEEKDEELKSATKN